MTTILIVDDDKEIGMIFQLALRKVNYQVHYASSGAAAYELAQQLRPQIIFVDLHLAHSSLSGWDLIFQLRACNDCQIGVIIGITAGSEKDIEQAYQAGCNEVLRKPFLAQKLLDTITKYMAN